MPGCRRWARRLWAACLLEAWFVLGLQSAKWVTVVGPVGRTHPEDAGDSVSVTELPSADSAPDVPTCVRL